jgi:hypothetical protein
MRCSADDSGVGIDANKNPTARFQGEAPASAAERARRILQLYLDERIDLLHALIHPEADLEAGFATPSARFAAENVLDAAWVAVSSGAYRPAYEVVESLDGDTALVGATIRYEIGEGLLSEREATYLMTFRDGLLWRTRIFDSVEEALAAYGATASS